MKRNLLKQNWYIDFIFLGEGVVVHINIILLLLFAQLHISFPVLFYYSLVGIHVNWGASFVLILSYVSDRKELSLSEHKLENLFFFTCLLVMQENQLGQTDKINFKIYDTKTWLSNDYNTHIEIFFFKNHASDQRLVLDLLFFLKKLELDLSGLQLGFNTV